MLMCPRCGKWKGEKEFQERVDRKDDIDGYCKECRKEILQEKRDAESLMNKYLKEKNNESSLSEIKKETLSSPGSGKSEKSKNEKKREKTRKNEKK